MRSIANYAARQSSGGILPAGNYVAKIAEMVEINDRTKWDDGKQKDQLPEWMDATSQLGVLFKVDGKGSIVHRFNLMGFVKFSEIEDYNVKAKNGTFDAVAEKLGMEEADEAWVPVNKKDYRADLETGYAVHKVTKKRLEDPERTEKAFRFIDQLIHDCGLPIGSNPFDCKNQQCGIRVVSKKYNGNENFEVQRTYMPREVMSEINVEEASDE